VTFFQREFGGSMDRKVTGHSVKSIKRQARKIQKNIGLTYLKALDQAAINAGFTGYKNFLNFNPQQVKPKRKRTIKRPQIPKPSVKEFYPALITIRHLRPNAKMPIVKHQELGALLKVLKAATYNHKRASRPLKEVANLLDEWVQREYNRQEMSDEIFFNLYFADVDTESEVLPSYERKAELIQMCRKAQSIVTNEYHDCGPVRGLLRKLDIVIKWLAVWPAAKPQHQYGNAGVAISGGTLIKIKSSKKPAILIQHQTRNKTVICYTDKGPMTAARFEVIVPKDQSLLKDFKPMRLWLPYGKWILGDGIEVLFNRDYCPLWAKSPNGSVIPLDPDVWVEKNVQEEYFFNDRTAPWHGNKRSFADCFAALKEWGVEKLNSGPLRLLSTAIATGDTDTLRPKHKGKYFPHKLT
jgi:hypothetical protein